MDLQVVTEVGTLGEQNEVGQRLASGDNLITAILLNAELVLGITHDGDTRRKLTLTSKCHRVLDIVDLHGLGRKQGHITADLLEIHRRHRDPRGKLRLRHVDAILITIEKLELLGGHALLFAVFQNDVEVIGVIPRNRKRKRVVIRRGLHNALEVIRRESNDKLSRGVGLRLLLELVRKQAEMNKNGTGIVHRNHTEALLIENQAHLDENTLECLDEGANGRGLNGLGLHDELGHAYYVMRGRFMKVVRGSRLI